MSITNTANPGRENLVDLGQRLAAVLDHPESANFGTFASLVGRLHAELAMAGDESEEFEDGELLFENFIESLDDCRPGC